MRRLRLRAGALLVAIVSLLAPTSARAGELVLPPTTTAAERVVDEYNAENTQNNATLDLEGQAAIEAPPIKTIDDAIFREYQGRGQTSLGDPFTVDDVEVFVPDQSSYPLVFLAREELRSPDQPEPVEQLLAFTKASSDSAWKATLAASFVLGGEVPDVATDRNGLATLVRSSDPTLKVKPTKLAAKLARLWQQSADGASLTKPFAPGLLTTEAIAIFLGELEQLPLPESNVDFTFQPVEGQPTCVRASGDGALCFFVVSYRAVLEPVSGTYTQPATREVLTGLVPPGEYGSVTFERDAIVLAAVPKRGRLARVDIVGFYNGLVAAETSPPGVGAPDEAV